MLSVRLKGVFKKASEFFGRLISFFVKLVSSGMFILLLKSCFYQIIWSRPNESSVLSPRLNSSKGKISIPWQSQSSTVTTRDCRSSIFLDLFQLGKKLLNKNKQKKKE